MRIFVLHWMSGSCQKKKTERTDERYVNHPLTATHIISPANNNKHMRDRLSRTRVSAIFCMLCACESKIKR